MYLAFQRGFEQGESQTREKEGLYHFLKIKGCNESMKRNEMK